MSGVEIAVVFFGCAILSFFFYGMWLIENDNDAFRKEHGVKPKYYMCVTKGDAYCNHISQCNSSEK